jgi:UDP-N-acetylglucosamine 4,6-dehydratase
MSSVLTGSSILLTGGTGTAGHAFVRRALREGARRVVIFSRDELKQSVMSHQFSDNRLRFFIGDVRDRDRLRIALQGVDHVIHAAALKQINIGEYNPSEFIKTNILGTENVLFAAADVGVKKVILLSSDKAAAPVTLYGSTKSVAEHLVRAGQSYNPTGTKFAALRYGNVAGSRGSVIPIWRGLIRAGVTELPVTHPECTRFFFRIEDAVDFALWSLQHMQGGELFVPLMPSFRIVDLVEAMRATYKVTGTRGVEKLHESMISQEEARYFRKWQGRYCRFIDNDIGDPLPEGFEYSSHTNDHWLNVDSLRRLLDETPEVMAA